MSGARSSSMDVNLGQSQAPRGASRVSAAEARRLQEESLQRYNADNVNNLLPRLWDRAGAQSTQHNGGGGGGGQTGSRPNGGA